MKVTLKEPFNLKLPNGGARVVRLWNTKNTNSMEWVNTSWIKISVFKQILLLPAESIAYVEVAEEA